MYTCEYLSLVDFIIKNYALDDKNVDFLGLNDPLLKEIMRKKLYYIEQMKSYDINFVSLGENCFPITLLTKWGLIRPLAIRRKNSLGRMPFDLSITPVSSVVHILPHNISLIKADGVVKFLSNYSFYDSTNHIHFAHSYIDTTNDLDNDIKKFNNETLNVWKRNLSNSLIMRNLIFIINIYFTESHLYFDDLQNLILNNLSSDLLILSQAQTCYLKHNKLYYAIPYRGYSWHNPSSYYTYEGLNFETSIIDLIICYIKNNYLILKFENEDFYNNYINLYLRLSKYYLLIGDNAKYKYWLNIVNKYQENETYKIV